MPFLSDQFTRILVALKSHTVWARGDELGTATTFYVSRVLMNITCVHCVVPSLLCIWVQLSALRRRQVSTSLSRPPHPCVQPRHPEGESAPHRPSLCTIYLPARVESIPTRSPCVSSLPCSSRAPTDMSDSPSHLGPLNNSNSNNNTNTNNTNNTNTTTTATTTTNSSSSSSNHAGYHAVRRSLTVDDGAQPRRRTPVSPLTSDIQFEPLRRRSSTFSEYSLAEARRSLQDDILNPGAFPVKTDSPTWSSVPLAFALLPALGGVFFKDGSAVVTDIMLLGLAAVFLQWSVTQPWSVLSYGHSYHPFANGQAGYGTIARRR